MSNEWTEQVNLKQGNLKISMNSLTFDPRAGFWGEFNFLIPKMPVIF